MRTKKAAAGATAATSKNAASKEEKKNTAAAASSSPSETTSTSSNSNQKKVLRAKYTPKENTSPSPSPISKKQAIATEEPVREAKKEQPQKEARASEAKEQEKKGSFEEKSPVSSSPSIFERDLHLETEEVTEEEKEGKAKSSEIPAGSVFPPSFSPSSSKVELQLRPSQKIESIGAEQQQEETEKAQKSPFASPSGSEELQQQESPAPTTVLEQELQQAPPLEDSEQQAALEGEAIPQVEEIKIELTKQKFKRRGKKRKKVKKQLEEESDAKVKNKSKEKVAFSDLMLRFALKYTRFPTRFIAKRLPSLRDNLLKSNLRISPEGLISLSLLFTFISVPLAIFGTFELASMGLVPYAYFLPAVIVLPFLIGISIPKVSASSRASALENELPYLFAYITVLAGGGISPMVTLKRISKAAKIFPAAAREAARILMDIEIFGLDAISALEREAKLTPNKAFSDFVGGYVSVLKTGGDALSYLEAKLKEIFTYREAKQRASSEFIATMSEAYIITTVVMGVSLMVLWATQNLMSPNGLPSSSQSVNSTIIVMFSGFAVPLISLIFIIVIGSSQIREPFSYDRPFYVFLLCMPLGALIYFNPIGLSPYMKLGLALTAISTPAMVVQMIFKKRKQSVEAKLANFLRDLSEVRKTGLAPEKTIEQLANRNYGGLTKHVKKIAAQVSWGTPLKTVLQTFIKDVKSWVGRAVAFLLLEVVDVGGGSAKMFISLADFTEKNAQLDKERKSQIRPYVIIPYIGAILVVATTAMMVYYAGFSYTNIPGVPTNFAPSPQILAQATTTLLMAAFFQAWVMGFVAGKMGEGSAADGFKHATFLIVISMVTVLISQLFIKL